MRHRHLARATKGIALAASVFALAAFARSLEPREPRTIESNAGTYLVELETEPAEIPLNEAFDLAVRVRANDGEGAPPEGILLSFDARMPQHRHGMRVVPTIGSLGEGRFRVEGARLHMPGAWELHFDVTRGAITERAQERIELE